MMAYDQKICDEYVSWLNAMNGTKQTIKTLERCLRDMEQISRFIRISASDIVKKALVKRIEREKKRLIDFQQQSKKATKAYQEYCAQKEST
jgi:hypothetical protein